MSEIKPKMDEYGEPVCSEECPQYGRCYGIGTWRSPQFGEPCAPKLMEQRDEYRDKMNEARRGICRGDVGSELQLGNMVSPKEIAKQYGWKCFEGVE